MIKGAAIFAVGSGCGLVVGAVLGIAIALRGPSHPYERKADSGL